MIQSTRLQFNAELRPAQLALVRHFVFPVNVCFFVSKFMSFLSWPNHIICYQALFRGKCMSTYAVGLGTTYDVTSGDALNVSNPEFRNSSV
jgi:hypothetical protein